MELSLGIGQNDSRRSGGIEVGDANRVGDESGSVRFMLVALERFNGILICGCGCCAVLTATAPSSGTANRDPKVDPN